MPHHLEPQDEPGVATPENNLVTLDGPGGVAITLTPDAAAETGRRLIAAAEAAGARDPASAEGAQGFET